MFALLLAFTLFPGEPEITLVAVGDVMMARGVESSCRDRGWDYPFDQTRPVLASADLVFGNLESPISGRGKPVGSRHVFRADPHCLPALKRAGFSVMSLANNHALDYGQEALQDTLDGLRSIGIMPVGAGRTAQEVEAGAIVEVGGIRIGFFAFTVFAPREDGTSSAAAVGFMSDSSIRRGIARLKRKADVVIVSAHWGREYQEKAGPMQRRLARLAIDAGATLVLGHHPHVPQEVEWYRTGLIAYSLGDFVFDSRSRGGRGLLLTCVIKRAGVASYTARPVVVVEGQPRLVE